MTIDYWLFELIIYSAIGITVFAPTILIALFINDWIKDRLW